MKKVLILVLSADVPPYDEMMQTSQNTWDSINIEGCETLYYCDASEKPNTEKVIYVDTVYNLFTMGRKDLLAYEWILANKEFDYVARVNSSCYVNKKELIKYVQNLPEKDLFSGFTVPVENGDPYMWGGLQFVISRDVIQKMVDNKWNWNHKVMEDQAMSELVRSLGIPFHEGKACSIDKQLNDSWLLLAYGGGDNMVFADFAELNKLDNHFFYRVKCDGQRSVDKFVMEEMFKCLS